MDSNPDVIQLLTEIRDSQRRQIEAYDRVTSQSLEMQRRAVERQDEAVDRQKRITKIYLRSLLVGGVLVAGLLVLLAYLLQLL